MAPFGERPKPTSYFKRKTKSYSFGRDEERASNDPDRHPWILSDFEESHTYTGDLQNQSSTFALFVFSVLFTTLIKQNDGFRVVPVSKFYKFNPKVKHRVLSTEEAESKIGNVTSKPVDRWMMHKKEVSFPYKNSVFQNPDSPGTSSSAKVVKKEPIKDWKRKLLEQDETDAQPPPRKRKSKKQGQEELDYEEEFADDEEVDFGIEDAEEAKEASQRQYGRAGKQSFFNAEHSDFSDTDEKMPASNIEKALTKALRKFEKNDAYDLGEEENPYISDAVTCFLQIFTLEGRR